MGSGRAWRGPAVVTLAGALAVGPGWAASADPTRDAQWALATYRAETAVWPHSTGKGVTVAVIDSGVRATHLDLRGQVLPGTDFAFGGDGRTDHSPEGHGTGMASVIAGHGHGLEDWDGVKGLAPGAKILPIGVGSGATGLAPDYVPQAIRYAVDHGAQVISLSIGSPTADPAEESAVAYAEQHNVVLVAASGNDGTTRKQYPASWPGVIKVSAVGPDGTLWPGSTTGGVTVAAPGVHIERDGGANDTQVYGASGTSDAAAYVAAIAALYRSAHPSLTAGQVVRYIVGTAVLPKGHTAPDSGLGYGIARPALTEVLAPGPAAGPLPQASAVPDMNGAGASGTDADPGILTGMVLGLVGGIGVAVGDLLVELALAVRTRRASRDSDAEDAAPDAEESVAHEVPLDAAFPLRPSRSGNLG